MPRVRVGALDLAPQGAPTKPWEPDRWSPRHELAARLKGAGHTNADIARLLEWSENHVSIILNDERAKPVIREVASRQADGILDLNLRLKAHATEAMDEIVTQMRHGSKEQVRQKAAFGILDRAGYTPVQKHTVVPQPTLPPELGRLVAEAHAEITETRREIRFRAPLPAELALPTGREVSSGTDG